MIHDDGAAKITDFGVAKIVSQQMTQSGTMMGTPSYMSPEQIQGATVDGRADQFALSVIAYEMLTGEKPFAAEYLPSLLYKICREEPVPPQRLNTTLSSETEAVLKKGLAKTADDRYPHCTAFIAELEKAVSVKPDWVPLPRGSSQNMPTVAALSSTPLEPPRDEPATIIGEPEITPAAIAAAVGPVPATAAPDAPSSDAEPPLRVRQRLEDTETHTVRNVVLALASIIIIGVMVLVAQKWTSPKPAPVASTPTETARTAEPKTTPAAPALPPPPKIEKTEPAATAPAKTEAVNPEPAQQAAIPAQHDEKPSPVHARTEEPRTPLPGAEAPAQFTTTPPGAKIVVDDNAAFVCTTPCQLPLTPGRHTLAASLDGYRIARRIFEMPRDADMNVSLDQMKGTLSIITDPPGATIAINGQTRSEKSPLILSLPVGTYQLRVAKGRLHYEENVKIQDGALAQRRYTLE